jgi:hypothetical protein
MRSLRFNHIFLGLLALSAASAFVIPARVSDRLRGNLQVVFYPIARPTHALAGWFTKRVAPERPRDDGAVDPNHPREMAELLRDNSALRVHLANLTGRLERLEQLDRDLASVGEAREMCERFSVMGAAADPALREALHITAKTGDGVTPDQPVLYGGIGGGGIAGKVASAHLAGSTVRLVTDRDFAVKVGFARFADDDKDGRREFTVIATPVVLAKGDGRGTMWIRNSLTMQDATSSGLRAEDWVILMDEDWPDVLQRYRIGRIVSCGPDPKSPLFAEVKVVPGTNLLKLDDVLVMVK